MTKKFFAKIDEFFLLNKNRSLPELDGVRAWAIVMVMMAHIGAWVTNIASEASNQTFSIKAITTITYYFPFIGTAGGAAGVDLFFILSGFLIFMTLRKKEVSFGTFIKKRYQRLLPVHIILLLSLVVPLSFPSLLINIFFLAEFFPSFKNVHLISWTLSYEMLFYFLCAFWFIHFGKRKQLQTWTTFGIVFIFTFFSPWFLTKPFEVIGIKYIESSRFIAFLFGVGLAKLYLLDKKRWMRYEKVLRYSFILGLFMVLVFRYSYLAVSTQIKYGQFWKSVSYLWLDSGFFMIIASLLTKGNNMIKTIFGNRFIRVIGVISYSMYLFHYQFALPLSKNLLSFVPSIPLKMIIYVPVSFFVTIIVSIFLFHYLEKPYFLHKKK